jgi:SWI/SNF-related matrix-associated actin-dependent regulator 1 of chromatin subfamily A
MFPPSSLSTAEEVLCSVPGLTVEVSSVIKKRSCLLQQHSFDHFILLPSCLVD